MAIKKYEMIEPMKKSLGGFYNYAVGIELTRLIKENQEVLKDSFKK